MSNSDDYSCHVQIVNGADVFTLQLAAQTDKHMQLWTSDPQNTIAHNSTSRWAVLDTQSSAQGAGGYLTYKVEENGTELTFYFSNPMLGDNKASFDANGVNVTFVTKVGDGSWSDAGDVAQGAGPFYVQFTLS